MPDCCMLLQVQQAVAHAEVTFGPLDVVIANAGMPSSSKPSMSSETMPSLCVIANLSSLMTPMA